MCNAAIRNAHRQQRQRRLDTLSSTLARAQDAQDAGEMLRKELIERAISYDIAATGLAGTCAIMYALNVTDEELRSLANELPAHVLNKIEKARVRLRVLEDAETVSRESFLEV